MAIHVEEMRLLCEAFVMTVGKNFNMEEFQEATKTLGTEYVMFHPFLAFVETKYASSIEVGGLQEGVRDLFDTYSQDVLRKVFSPIHL